MNYSLLYLLDEEAQTDSAKL